MREVSRWTSKDRRDLFQETAVEMGVHPAIVEKDFWVCWVLDYLFDGSPWKEHLSFKGGTSLSKAFGAIERFSEDIDLILDWRMLGYTSTEPLEDRSATQQDRFGKLANQRAADFLRHTVAPTLGTELAESVTEALDVHAEGENVLISYPRAFALDAIQPEIRLESAPGREMAAPEIDGRAYPKQVAAPKRFEWPRSAEMEKWPRPKYACGAHLLGKGDHSPPGGPPQHGQTTAPALFSPLLRSLSNDAVTALRRGDQARGSTAGGCGIQETLLPVTLGQLRFRPPRKSAAIAPATSSQSASG